jgi:outer membrane biogenesis lipoprotein LolB
MRAALIAAAASALLAACGEKPQVAATGKADATPYQGTGVAAFTAPGWKAGDRAAWEQQLKTRAQGQNDYVKVN